METNLVNDVEYIKFLEISIILNIFLTIIFILIGLCVNFIIILVYGQSKNRVNSSNIFIFCLAILDASFLIIHFFEDTLRTIRNTKYMFPNNEINYDLIEKLNIIDRDFLMCSLANYLKYTVRFIQAYTVNSFSKNLYINIIYFYYIFLGDCVHHSAFFHSKLTLN